MLVGDDADGMRWFGVAPLPAKIICNTWKAVEGGRRGAPNLWREEIHTEFLLKMAGKGYY